MIISIILIVLFVISYTTYYFIKLSFFNIVVFVANNKLNPFDLAASKMIFRIQPKIRNKLDHKYIFADPFLFVYHSELYLFYEEKSKLNNGIIKGFKTNNLYEWKDLGIILQENCHLSFPFIYKMEDEIYMIPETFQDSSIRLYKFDDFPYGCKFQRYLLTGDEYKDSHIFEKDGAHYLFTNIRNDELELFFSTDMISWKKHPKSPVVTGNDKSRSGGSLLKYRNKIYRVAQDTSSYYGKNFHLFEIKRISSSEFDEVESLRNVINNDMSWNKKGGHHFNMVVFNDSVICACDGKMRITMVDAFLYPFFRVMEKLYKVTKK